MAELTALLDTAPHGLITIILLLLTAATAGLLHLFFYSPGEPTETDAAPAPKKSKADSHKSEALTITITTKGGEK